MTDSIPDSGLTSGNGASPYLARYCYVPLTMPNPLVQPTGGIFELERVSNINPDAVAMFRRHYADDGIDDDDLFYYTYGVLHSEQYRERYAADLRKTAARIPWAKTRADFRAFTAAGRELADLHVNYESVEPCPTVREVHAPGWEPGAPEAYRVQKMRYGGPARNLDQTAIVYNAGITLTGIPEQAHQYRLGSRSALDWLIDRYQVRTDTKSGIVNDPNDWCAEQGNPRYIVDLVKRIAAVSVRTVDIVNRLPELPL
jgi:predicted helicase